MVDSPHAPDSSLPEPHYCPWVGDNYGKTSEFGVGVLVVGGFHYGWPEPCATRKFVCDQREGTGKKFRLFSFGASVLKGVPERDVRENGGLPIWDEVAFCNYIQRSDLERGMKPTEKNYCEALDPFKWVLQKWDPRLVLVLSRAVSDHLKPLEKEGRFGNRTFVWGRHPQGLSLTEIAAIRRCFQKQKELEQAKQGATAGS